jgi:hypothetical protein
MCQKKGVRLLTIFEDELNFKLGVTLSRIAHILNHRSGFKVYARDCQIKMISFKESSRFLDLYHLQGRGNSSIRLGAFYGDYLLAVMTFSSHSLPKRRLKKEGRFELDRFAVHSDYCLTGIASKMLCFFERHYEWSELITFADRRWSVGNLYYRLGFSFDHFTSPCYWYLDKNYSKRIHRFGLRKTISDDSSLTEWENRQRQGYDRIWDCGHMRFTKKNSRL